MSETSNLIVFPGDELGRQSKEWIQKYSKGQPWAHTEDVWYDKTHINLILTNILESIKEKSPIHIPRTFNLSEVCIKPRKLSAGSRGIQLIDGACVSERINIKREYVADCLYNKDVLSVFPREVRLRSGYDSMIRLLPTSGQLAEHVKTFIKIVDNELGIFAAPGVFHIQIAEDFSGKLYYIESSRRISGTSIVNLFQGFNPFAFINGIFAPAQPTPYKYNQWYRYEDFMLNIENFINSES